MMLSRCYDYCWRSCSFHCRCLLWKLGTKYSQCFCRYSYSHSCRCWYKHECWLFVWYWYWNKFLHYQKVILLLLYYITIRQVPFRCVLSQLRRRSSMPYALILSPFDSFLASAAVNRCISGCDRNFILKNVENRLTATWSAHYALWEHDVRFFTG